MNGAELRPTAGEKLEQIWPEVSVYSGPVDLPIGLVIEINLKVTKHKRDYLPCCTWVDIYIAIKYGGKSARFLSLREGKAVIMPDALEDYLDIDSWAARYLADFCNRQINVNAPVFGGY